MTGLLIFMGIFCLKIEDCHDLVKEMSNYLEEVEVIS